MKPMPLRFELIPIEYLQEDPDHPRALPETEVLEERDEKKEKIKDRLFTSMEMVGVLQPLEVMETDQENRYTIIDGHRRYRFAKKLGIEKLPCVIFPKMPRGEFAYRQYEMQNTKKDWKPMERSEAFSNIKQTLNISSNRKLAEFLGLSSTIVSAALKLLEIHSRYVKLMEKHELPMTYQYEFIRMKDKIIKVKELEISEIIPLLFEKVQRRIIKNAKDFRVLGTVFEEGKRNEKEIYTFLKSSDMRVEELEERTEEPPIMLYAGKLLRELADKLAASEKLSADEKKICAELKDLIHTSS